MTASLEALLASLVDYAGLFPPAGLPLAQAAENYRRYLDSPESRLLNRLVLPAARLAEAPLEPGLRITLLVDGEPGPLPPQVETLETKLARRLSLPTYCEAPPGRIEAAFAKIRTGGLTPEAIPAPAAIADFLVEAAARRLPFKATAGLHHPIRSLRPLTCEAGGPSAVMHGFINVFVAAALAWHGGGRADVLRAVDEDDARAFGFGDDALRWRGHKLSTAQIAAARRDFAHSFGSCSFEEPVEDLRRLGWLE